MWLREGHDISTELRRHSWSQQGMVFTVRKSTGKVNSDRETVSSQIDSRLKKCGPRQLAMSLVQHLPSSHLTGRAYGETTYSRRGCIIVIDIHSLITECGHGFAEVDLYTGIRFVLVYGKKYER